MAMTEETFAVLVEQLEEYARQNPLDYKIRVGLLAALGYVYIVAILAGLLAIGWTVISLVIYSNQINAGTIKLFIIILVPAIIALRSLWESFTMRFPPPTGIELQYDEVPQLFDLIDELTTALRCPSFHHILLTSELNAAVSQVPRGFLLRGQENYLIVGLPLLQAVSPDQFRAILAHELGHLSGKHSQFDGWIYRMRKTWMQLLDRLQQSQYGAVTFIFERFLNWYAPFFNAYSFVLARADEYEADLCAARLAGNQAAASALIVTNIKAFFLHESFWMRIYKHADEHPEPPRKLFNRMASELKTAIKPEEERQWLEQALATPTNLDDTHPCLTDRLKALGVSPELAPLLIVPIEKTAAEEFLGEAIAPLTDRLNQEWKTAITFKWHERYSQTQEMRQELQAIANKAICGNLTLDEAWNLARLTSQLKSNAEAIPLLKAVLEIRPNHVSANYWLGQILLEEGDELGISYLEAAMLKDPEIVLDCYRYIYYFLYRQGKKTEAESYRQRAQDRYEKLEMAKQERSRVSGGDRFFEHSLSSDKLEALCQQLATYPEVKEAYLVQKEVRFFPEKPFYVLGIQRNSTWLEMNGSDRDIDLVNRLAEELKCPRKTWIVILNHAPALLAKSIKKTASQPFFTR